MTVETKTEPTVEKASKLVIHIVQRDKGGKLLDLTLCGKLWDHPVVTSKDICEECIEVAKKEGHEWRM